METVRDQTVGGSCHLVSQKNLSLEPTDLLERLKQMHTGYFFRPDPTLVNQLKNVSSIELKNLLASLFSEVVQNGCVTDPIKFLDRLATLIPLEAIEAATQENGFDALQEAKDMFEEAKHYLQMTQGSSSLNLRASISFVLDGMISLIEILVSAFGVGGFFKAPESEMQAEAKSHKVMMLVSLFSTVTQMLIPLLKTEAGAKIAGRVFIGIVAVSSIWPWVKPMTQNLPHAVNWTKQVELGRLVAEGRKESLDEIASILKAGRNPILVGDPRVGKSLTAKAFAQAVARGNYPELKGKVVFRINVADLIGQQGFSFFGSDDVLSKISAQMGRHRGNIILVLDEIHMACKNKEKIGDQLKTLIEEGGDFAQVIGITTTDEYEHIRGNGALSLRFDKVDIKNTNDAETLKVLSDAVLTSRLKPIIAAEALDRVYKRAQACPQAPQPTTSLKLLKQCINQTNQTQTSPVQKQIAEISNKILSLRAQAAASRGRKRGTKTEISQLEGTMHGLQEQLSREQEELDKLFKSKDLLDRVTKETYSSVLKIAALGSATLHAKNEPQVKRFALLHMFLGPLLQQHINETAKRLGVHAVIDDGLIDSIDQRLFDPTEQKD